MSTLDEVRELGRGTDDATAARWVEVCHLDDLVPERGAAALVDGHQVALFRLLDGSVHAIGNLDPFSGAQVLARGIVGTRGGAPMVASPLYKQHVDLLSGRCLEQPGTRVPVYPVRVVARTVLLAVDPVPLENPDGLAGLAVADGPAAGAQPDQVPRDG